MLFHHDITRSIVKLEDKVALYLISTLYLHGYIVLYIVIAYTNTARSTMAAIQCCHLDAQSTLLVLSVIDIHIVYDHPI